MIYIYVHSDYMQNTTYLTTTLQKFFYFLLLCHICWKLVSPSKPTKLVPIWKFRSKIERSASTLSKKKRNEFCCSSFTCYLFNMYSLIIESTVASNILKMISSNIPEQFRQHEDVGKCTYRKYEIKLETNGSFISSVFVSYLFLNNNSMRKLICLESIW